MPLHEDLDTARTALPTPHSTTGPASSSAHASPRVDMFALIHKALRCAMCDRLMLLGATDFDDPRAADEAVEAVDAVLTMLEKHAEHEDRHLRPALAGRAHDTRIFDAGHAHQACLTAEVRSIAGAVETAPPEKRALVGRTLYLQFAALVADNFAHMAEEEQRLQPVLERLCTDEELLTMRGRIVASMTEAERAAAGRWMWRAASPAEHVVLMTLGVRGEQ